MRVSASGIVRDASGIGVLQRMLYRELETLGFSIRLLPTRDLGDRVDERVRGLIAGYLAKPTDDVLLSTVSPLPALSTKHVAAYVYDLRWRRTRSALARGYRHLDFANTMRRADRILTISHTVANEIADFNPHNAHKVRVVYPGPGQVERARPPEKIPGKIVLIGNAVHKRNEFALQALLRARPNWLAEIVGINLSDTGRHILQSATRYGVQYKTNISQAELIQELGSAEYYLNLGLEEGFGLPYIEALALGCQVIAADQPLTRELLVGGAHLIVAESASETSEQLRTLIPISPEDRKKVAERFSWRTAADQVASTLREIPT